MARALTAALVALALVLLGGAVALARALDRRGEQRAQQTRRTILDALEGLRRDLLAGRERRLSDRPSPPPPPALH